jgi:hypothetical protein
MQIQKLNRKDAKGVKGTAKGLALFAPSRPPCNSRLTPYLKPKMRLPAQMASTLPS